MEGSLRGGGGRGDRATGFYLFSNPVIQFPRLGWQISNWDVKTPTGHRPEIYWIFWWKSINYVWSLKFVILVVTIKGISQQFKNHLSLKYLIEVKLQSSFFELLLTHQRIRVSDKVKCSIIHIMRHNQNWQGPNIS